VADAATRPQWRRPTLPSCAVPAAPFTIFRYTLWRARDTLVVSALATVVSRHLGWHSQCSTEEEDVISQEATTVHGRQRIGGHYIAEQMLRMWEDQANAHPVSILRGCNQNHHIRPTQLEHTTTDREAGQATATRETPRFTEKAHDDARPEKDRRRAGSEAHRMEEMIVSSVTRGETERHDFLLVATIFVHMGMGVVQAFATTVH